MKDAVDTAAIFIADELDSDFKKEVCLIIVCETRNNCGREITKATSEDEKLE